MGGEKTLPMWQALRIILVLVTIGSGSDGAICPSGCYCNDSNLTASCPSAGFDVVPIQLNPEVNHLNLYNNKIDSVYFTLAIYRNLVALNLSTNRIKVLGPLSFLGQDLLTHLNLSTNGIKALGKESLRGLKAVVTLDLSHNLIDTLDWEVFRELHSLQILKLSDNRIVHLEQDIFKSTKQLHQLFLDQNMFLEMPVELADAINLRYLSLSNNLLKSIEENTMPNIPALRTLLLANNVINEIHQNALSKLVSLDHLDLSDNNLTSIPTASLAKLSNMTKLKLTGNFMKIVPPVAFRGLFHLRFLRLDRQELLERIDARAFVDNINLEKVWLDDNIALETLPTRLFHGNPHVVYLAVRNNRLSNLEVTHFPLDQLRVLKLAGNPLQCNCSLSWLWHLMQEQKKRSVEGSLNYTDDSNDLIVDLDDIRCAGPESLADVLLVDATESQVDCSIGWIAVVSATVTALFIIIILGGLLYWGPIRRTRAKERKLAERRCKAISANCSDRRGEPFDGARQADKCMIAPPLVHQDFRNLPLWDPYVAECALGTINIYEQLDINGQLKPHIVYV